MKSNSASLRRSAADVSNQEYRCKDDILRKMSWIRLPAPQGVQYLDEEAADRFERLEKRQKSLKPEDIETKATMIRNQIAAQEQIIVGQITKWWTEKIRTPVSEDVIYKRGWEGTLGGEESLIWEDIKFARIETMELSSFVYEPAMLYARLYAGHSCVVFYWIESGTSSAVNIIGIFYPREPATRVDCATVPIQTLLHKIPWINLNYALRHKDALPEDHCLITGATSFVAFEREYHQQVSSSGKQYANLFTAAKMSADDGKTNFIRLYAETVMSLYAQLNDPNCSSTSPQMTTGVPEVRFSHGSQTEGFVVSNYLKKLDLSFHEDRCADYLNRVLLGLYAILCSRADPAFAAELLRAEACILSARINALWPREDNTRNVLLSNGHIFHEEENTYGTAEKLRDCLSPSIMDAERSLPLSELPELEEVNNNHAAKSKKKMQPKREFRFLNSQNKVQKYYTELSNQGTSVLYALIPEEPEEGDVNCNDTHKNEPSEIHFLDNLFLTACAWRRTAARKSCIALRGRPSEPKAEKMFGLLTNVESILTETLPLSGSNGNSMKQVLMDGTPVRVYFYVDINDYQTASKCEFDCDARAAVLCPLLSAIRSLWDFLRNKTVKIVNNRNGTVQLAGALKSGNNAGTTSNRQSFSLYANTLTCPPLFTLDDRTFHELIDKREKDFSEYMEEFLASHAEIRSCNGYTYKLVCFKNWVVTQRSALYTLISLLSTQAAIGASGLKILTNPELYEEGSEFAYLPIRSTDDSTSSSSNNLSNGARSEPLIIHPYMSAAAVSQTVNIKSLEGIMELCKRMKEDDLRRRREKLNATPILNAREGNMDLAVKRSVHTFMKYYSEHRMPKRFMIVHKEEMSHDISSLFDFAYLDKTQTALIEDESTGAVTAAPSAAASEVEDDCSSVVSETRSSYSESTSSNITGTSSSTDNPTDNRAKHLICGWTGKTNDQCDTCSKKTAQVWGWMIEEDKEDQTLPHSQTAKRQLVMFQYLHYKQVDKYLFAHYLQDLRKLKAALDSLSNSLANRNSLWRNTRGPSLNEVCDELAARMGFLEAWKIAKEALDNQRRMVNEKLVERQTDRAFADLMIQFQQTNETEEYDIGQSGTEAEKAAKKEQTLKSGANETRFEPLQIEAMKHLIAKDVEGFVDQLPNISIKHSSSNPSRELRYGNKGSLAVHLDEKMYAREDGNIGYQYKGSWTSFGDVGCVRKDIIDLVRFQCGVNFRHACFYCFDYLCKKYGREDVAKILANAGEYLSQVLPAVFEPNGQRKSAETLPGGALTVGGGSKLLAQAKTIAESVASLCTLLERAEPKTLAKAARIWKEANNFVDTIGERYLKNSRAIIDPRKLRLSWRFHRAVVKYKKDSFKLSVKRKALETMERGGLRAVNPDDEQLEDSEAFHGSIRNNMLGKASTTAKTQQQQQQPTFSLTETRPVLVLPIYHPTRVTRREEESIDHLMGIHVIHIDPITEQKDEEVEVIKRTYGTMLPFALIRWADEKPRNDLLNFNPHGVRQAICEGPETGLTVASVFTDITVRAALSLRNIGNYARPVAHSDEPLLVLTDNDSNKKNRDALQEELTKLYYRGYTRLLVCTPGDYKDFNEIAKANRTTYPDIIKQQVHAATFFVPEKESLAKSLK